MNFRPWCRFLSLRAVRVLENLNYFVGRPLSSLLTCLHHSQCRLGFHLITRQLTPFLNMLIIFFYYINHQLSKLLPLDEEESTERYSD